MSSSREPPTPPLHDLDEPDRLYAAALNEAIHAAATTLDRERTLTLACLGPAPVCQRVMQEHAALGAWRHLATDAATSTSTLRLPQPPGPVVDLLVLGFALSQAAAHAGPVLGYALRTLRQPATTSRIVVLERIHAPLEAFVRETQSRLHPGTSRQPAELAPVPMHQRLAWHARWSPYTAADVQWLCATYGIILLERPQEIGHGRRYLVAQARPQLQVVPGNEPTGE